MHKIQQAHFSKTNPALNDIFCTILFHPTDTMQNASLFEESESLNEKFFHTKTYDNTDVKWGLLSIKESIQHQNSVRTKVHKFTDAKQNYARKVHTQV